MKKSVKSWFARWRKSDGMFWAAVILSIIFIIIAGYYVFDYITVCSTKECFENGIDTCKRVSWIREDNEAAWAYQITGRDENKLCLVNVKLLKMKGGTIDSEKLVGEEMICSVSKGEYFPERDTSQCHGLLKEEMQDILIQRMHNYLLQNVGQVQEGFEKV